MIQDNYFLLIVNRNYKIKVLQFSTLSEKNKLLQLYRRGL
jgi:hypothetical protein